jgi:adenylyl-sulfate kinase
VTGLPGSGKTTLCDAVENEFCEAGRSVVRLDGDDLRRSYGDSLGFSEADRHEQAARVRSLSLDACRGGSLALVSVVSPFEADRMAARVAHQAEGFGFFEIYLSTPLEICEARDPKGLWRKARLGEIEEFTGVSSPYEVPTASDLVLDTNEFELGDCVARVVELIRGPNSA